MRNLKETQIPKAKMLAVAAMCIALAFLLNQVTIFRMPMGGSVTPASMLFIVLAGYWLGPLYGVLSGLALGLLDISTGVTYNHPIQILLDYFLAFGVLGISGFFRKMKFGLQIGYFAGVMGRWLMVFISGLVFFSDSALGIWDSAFYSAIYNFNYIAPEMIVTFVIISLPSMKYAIDIVTKNVVPPAVYAEISAKSHGSASSAARIATGAVIGAIGGIAFVFAAYIQRMENLAIANFSSGFEIFNVDPTRIPRIYQVFAENPGNIARMIERNTEFIFAFQTIGVVLIATAAALLISTMKIEYSK
ncbi:MAG: energy-coupled thiamine transporter ThiT [Clostridiales bacterium]|jgi:thiamine transporter|nr:energy-coupled thiamine transporter ThiT [Clostridiales bacterium]